MLPTSISSSSSDAYEKQRFAGLKNLALERNYSSEQNSHSEQKPRSPLSFAEVSASLKLLFLSNDCARRAEAFTFRCHDGEHVSNTGKVITQDCNVCHTMIYDSLNPAASVKTGPFQHPVDLGGLADEHKCDYCHKANKPFQHPVNLGDISMFQCVQCHPKKQ